MCIPPDSFQVIIISIYEIVGLNFDFSPTHSGTWGAVQLLCTVVSGHISFLTWHKLRAIWALMVKQPLKTYCFLYLYLLMVTLLYKKLREQQAESGNG